MDKLASLRHRLNRKTESFDFSALIQGVSTLEEEVNTSGDAEKPVGSETDKDTADPVLLADPKDQDASAIDAQVQETVAAAVKAEPTGTLFDVPMAKAPAKSASSPAKAKGATPKPTTPPVEKVKAAEKAVKAAPTPAPTVTPAPGREERLRSAIDALGTRLLPEVGMMNAAFQSGDAEEAGFYLAHVNQILELLHSIDPTGDLARQLGSHNAPPRGRSWPRTAWSVAEFAESPLSGLLPGNADDLFVRDVLYAAWGVSVGE